MKSLPIQIIDRKGGQIVNTFIGISQSEASFLHVYRRALAELSITWISFGRQCVECIFDFQLMHINRKIRSLETLVYVRS